MVLCDTGRKDLYPATYAPLRATVLERFFYGAAKEFDGIFDGIY